MKRIALSGRAERALTDILDYSIETYGQRKAAAYRRALFEVVQRIARGEAQVRTCRDMLAPEAAAHLMFARAERHFIIFAETPSGIAVLDIIHRASNLAQRLATLDGP